MERFFCFCAFVCLFSASALAQVATPTATPAMDEEVVKITTALIQIDVTVTDSRGKIIRDLKPEEIEIYENGKKQPISNFSFISSTREINESQDAGKPPVSTVLTAPLKTEQVRRTIALVVDDLTLSFESTYHVRRALKKFVDEQMQDGDLVAIIRTGAGIGALQQFTSDRRMLYAAIEKVRWNASGTGRIGAFAPLEAKIIDNAPPDEEESEPGDRTPEIEREFNDFRNSVFASGTLGAVNYVVRGMSELPGRKSIMLLSDGFRMFTRDASSSVGSGRVLESVRRLVDQANRASVVIYTMDPRGLQITGITAADDTSGRTAEEIQQAASDRSNDLRETQDGLVYLARQTGGFAFVNNNDLSGGIRRVLDDQSYYLVGYEPDEDTFDPKTRRFNKLDIRVLRKGTRVRYRSGFFGVSDDKIIAGPKTSGSLLNALMSPFVVNEIPVRMNTLFGSNGSQGSFVRSLLHVTARDLTFTDGPKGEKIAVFDILAVAFGDNGVPADEISRKYTITLEKERYEAFVKRGFVYDFAFPIKKPGGYQLRVALRDVKSDKVGSASQFVEVPNLKKNRLTISGAGLESTTFEIWRRRNTANADSAPSNADPLTDTALRQFKKGSVISLGFVIFNAKTDATKKPNLYSQMRLFKDGVQVFQGEILPVSLNHQTDMKALNFLTSLSLGTSMSPGDYVLEIAITDNLAKGKYRAVSQYIQFEVLE